jgi:type I restriction enzyme M protein
MTTICLLVRVQAQDAGPFCGTGGGLLSPRRTCANITLQPNFRVWAGLQQRAFATAFRYAYKQVDHNGSGDNIRFGDSFNDQFPEESFDYLLTPTVDRLEEAARKRLAEHERGFAIAWCRLAAR